jgi:hypothetical protein
MEEHINAHKFSAFVDAVVFRVLNARLLFWGSRNRPDPSFQGARP